MRLSVRTAFVSTLGWLLIEGDGTPCLDAFLSNDQVVEAAGGYSAGQHVKTQVEVFPPVSIRVVLDSLQLAQV